VVALVASTTALDLALTGRLWVIPWYHALQGRAWSAWNASPWGVFGWLSLLWLPVGLWAISQQKDERGRLFVAYALGLLVSPYWAWHSLWPLVAMAGSQTPLWQSEAPSSEEASDC